MTDKIQSMVIFGMVFAILGYIIPTAIYTVIPASYFYNVEQPVSVDKKVYKVCDPIRLEIDRSSRVDVQAERLLQLSLVYDEGTQEITQLKRDVNVSAGRDKIFSDLLIPCDAPNGEYFVTGIVHFQVQNAQKNYRFVTSSFQINR